MASTLTGRQLLLQSAHFLVRLSNAAGKRFQLGIVAIKCVRQSCNLGQNLPL
ncbi:MAG: hypothetical protein JXQ99_21495 [Hyphomicrobiaceae bacterium]